MSAPRERLAFGPPQVFTTRALCALDPRRQAQVVQTITNVRGTACATFEDACVAIRDQIEADDDEPALALYPIFADGAVRFELWAYQDEHGLVFAVDADDATAVHCVQRHFWSVDDTDADAVALAAVLDALAW